MDNKQFKPYVPPDQNPHEFTWVSILLGAVLAIVFGGANAYLGLRVGMTISASIPAAVVSMGILRRVMHRNSILESNMVQTIGSAGESLAAGAIFTLPAMFMWAQEGLCEMPSLLEIGLITLCGGLLGVFLMIPLRNALIVQEHGVLSYPEGTACAEVLSAGEEKGAGSSTVFAGLGISAVYKFLADGLRLFPSEIDWTIRAYPGAGFGCDVLPALAGVGYICGLEVSTTLLAGGLFAWFVLMPMIVLFGSDKIIYPASITVAELWAEQGTWGIWSNFIRYIGAGAVTAAGIISLIRSLPMILRAFKSAVGGYGKKAAVTNRTERDLPIWAVLAGVLVLALLMWILPVIPVSPLGALIIILFGFFFAAVSSRMVGLIGSSNNPVSGMAIATLLIATILLKSTGNTGISGMIAALTIGSIICIIACIAGDTSQDLKTGFLLGATPMKQQIGEIIGCVVSAVAIGGILYLLNSAWGFGSAELSAPQAMLMKLVVEGVMEGNLPWALVFAGASITVILEILKLPSLPIAIGLYLPVHLSTPLVAGALVRWYLEKRKFASKDDRENAIQSGILYSSGLIAGEGIVGILLALAAVLGIGLDISGTVNLGNIGGMVFFALLLGSMCWYSFRHKSK